MNDIKFAINGLEAAKRLINIGPGTGSRKCRAMDACENAISLLREQEPVEPIYGLHGERHCGNCRNSLWVSGQRFCASCGRAVKWDD